LKEPACLATVRRDPEHFRTLLRPFDRHRVRVLELRRYDHIADPFPPVQQIPFPNLWQISGSVLTHAALLAADGRHAEALAETCDYAATWRRLRGHSDTILMDMFATVYAAGAAQLAAQIVADEPETEWTDECRRAFAPLAIADIEVCAEMRYEFGFVQALVPDPGESSWAWAANAAHVRAKSAPRYAALCHVQSPANRRIEREAALACSELEWLLDPVGCSILVKDPLSLVGYRDRVIDLDGQFAALRTAVWLRDQPREPGQAFELRPAELRTAEHDVELDASSGTLTLSRLEAGREPWTIPFARRR
jgi:hypothetical protein